MATLQSLQAGGPAVGVNEQQITTTVGAVSTTTGGTVINAPWGPAFVVTSVSSENDLISKFGKPDANTYQDVLVATQFLSYGNNLEVVRVANTANALNATANANANVAAVYIPNDTVYQQTYYSGGQVGTVGPFAARYPGGAGNGITVSLCPSSNAFNTWSYSSYFQGAPGTSSYATKKNGSNDQCHVIVIDTLGYFSGAANTVLETYPFVSKASDAVNDDGSTNSLRDVIFNESKYILWTGNIPGGTNWNTPAANTNFALASNTNYTQTLSGGLTVTPTTGDYETGWALLANPDSVALDLAFAAGASTTVANYMLQNVVGSRLDCVGFVSPQLSDVVNTPGNEVTNVSTTRNTFGSTSYGVMDDNYKYVYDKYNNVYRWIALNGDMAGLCVNADSLIGPWASPAGYNRGQIKNVVKLAWNPTSTQRGTLYNLGVDSVNSFPGFGPILFGDSTLLLQPSYFDQISVRRLFLYMEKAISKYARFVLFQNNTPATQQQFVNSVDPFLRGLQGQQAIGQYYIDATSGNINPPPKTFTANIWVQAYQSINWVLLNFVAVPTGVTISEILGQSP